MSRNLVILGAGGCARQVCWLVSRIGDFNIVGFYDETVEDEGEISGYPVRNAFESLIELSESPIMLISAVGNIGLRRRWHAEFGSRFEFATLIDPLALIAPSAHIGKDVIVQAFTTISTDVHIQDSTYISWNCLIAHDARVGKFSQISAGTKITGRCKVGDFCQLGTGCSILPDAEIGDGAIIGAGAVVNKNVPRNVMVAGVPAVIKKQIVDDH